MKFVILRILSSLSIDSICLRQSNGSVAAEVTDGSFQWYDTLKFSVVSACCRSDEGTVLLKTAIICIMDCNGRYQRCRAFIDGGSQANYMTVKCARRLGLPFTNVHGVVSGISCKTTQVHHEVIATISSLYGPYEKTITCPLLNDITGSLPTMKINLKSLNIPDDYFLADPQFYNPAEIDLLIGGELEPDVNLDGKVELPSGPIMEQTKFGWTIGGLVPTSSRSFLSSFVTKITPQQRQDDSLEEEFVEKLDKFISADDIESPTSIMTPEEKYCEQLFCETTTRTDDGKFQCYMPLKGSISDLGSNKTSALYQAYAVDGRRRKNPQYNELYTSYMNDVINEGYFSEVSLNDDEFSHFLPHHGVLKESSTTTKLRPVFNASKVSESGKSLNDLLCVGPVVQPELTDILLRSRETRFIIMGDITKMYMQVWIHPSQRNLLRIFWRPDLNKGMKCYQSNTVTFGTACAPYLATRVVKQLAIDNSESFPQAAKIIGQSIYVDDLIFGTNSIAEGIRRLTELRLIFAKAGMKLTKFVANQLELLQGIPLDQIESNPTDDSSLTKALGIGYHASSDSFFYKIKPADNKLRTKANVLSNIASIYDPIGWIGPVIMKAKLFMKSLWLKKLAWTDELPDDLKQEWMAFHSQLSSLNNIRINRQCFISNHVSIELHGFCDASISGYGAVIYALSRDEHGNSQVSLISSKSRVGPKNQRTLARLELCGSVLISRLMSHIKTVFNAHITNITYWSDSTIVLSWITLPPARLLTYVGNRVSVIQELTHENSWKHIRGEDNPADVISRGIDPTDIADCNLWWNGPSFFQSPTSEWPDPIISINIEHPDVVTELKKTFVTQSSSDMLMYIESRFSSHRTLINVIVYTQRFIDRLNKKSVPQEVETTVEERERAELFVIKLLQQSFFPQDYKILKKQKSERDEHGESKVQLPTSSTIISLSPFMDDQDVIRVGGRLEACQHFTFDQKHQIILPKCSYTRMFLLNLHLKHGHPGQKLMLALVRERYWPINAMSLIKHVKVRCITCFKHKPRDSHQYMADLPSARVTMSPPFSHTAVDYAGFYNIKSSNTNPRATPMKVYIALFKCMCTGAIHLEVVTDLSSEKFLAALTRFISRRGLSVELFSDNATCFEGTNNELRNIITSLEPEIRRFCTDEKITWRFTVPRAPHAGGYYEAGIKSMKYHLNLILPLHMLTLEELQTITSKVEAILNSRPLTPFTNDPDDLTALTPGHFLVGRPLTAPPERNRLDTPVKCLKNYQLMQKIYQQFWSVWYKEYLTTLQQRPRKFQHKIEYQVGDLVLLKESNLAPLKWMMGRIISIAPNKDNITRNVRVKTQKGELDRHIKYLCVLPLDEPDDQQLLRGPENVSVRK